MLFIAMLSSNRLLDLWYVLFILSRSNVLKIPIYRVDYYWKLVEMACTAIGCGKMYGYKLETSAKHDNRLRRFKYDLYFIFSERN